MENNIFTQRIISYQPKFIEFIDDPKKYLVFNDDILYPILKILIKEPLTVREIHRKYNELTGSNKSNKTIYRYIKKLVNIGLIKPSGKLIIKGKTASETLFGRNARIFFIENKEEFYDIARFQLILETIIIFLKPIFPNINLKQECLKKIIKKIDAEKISILKNLTNNPSKKVIELLQYLELDEINFVFEYVKLFYIIYEGDKYINMINDC